MGSRSDWETMRSAADVLDRLAVSHEVRVVSGEQGRPVSVTPDGEWLTTSHRDDIWLVPIHGGEPKVMIQTPFVEGAANFSPDGQWIAYQGFESGTSTHYVRRADGEGTRLTVAPTAANAIVAQDQA